MGERIDQLRRALDQELPGITFDDVVVQYLEDAVPDWAQASEDDVAELWSPFLLSHASAASDDEAAREVCQRLLARLRRQSGTAVGGDAARDPAARAAEVEGLREWMERLRLPLPRYHEHAQAWCEREGIRQVSGVTRRAQDFCDALQLKMLERKRVLDGVPPVPPAPPVPNPGPTPTLAAFGAPSSPYSILEELGSGANATVHRCTRKGAPDRPEEIFAVKIVSLQRLQLQQDASRAKEKLRRETENLFSLRHPNIVALHESFETSERLYLVMEFVDGGELFHHIVRSERPQGRLTESAAGFVFRQLVAALAYIHGRQIVHRDLKPENILVHRGDSRFEEGKLVVKISDFGHSKIIGEGYSIAQTVCGTPQYWAPEVAAPSARGYDEKVDLWSLGVVLFVMLEGIYPFGGGSMRLDEQVREAKYRPMKHGSPSAKEIVKGLIQKQPQDRLSLDRCLTHRWLQQMDTAPLDAAGQLQQVDDDEQFSLQVTPTETKRLREELHCFNAKHRVFPAVLRSGKVTVTWSATPELPPGGKEEARAELLDIISAFCPTGPPVAVGAPLPTVAEERGVRARPA